MKYSNKHLRQIGNSNAPFKLVDLGQCVDKNCPSADPNDFHSHALMYVKGAVEPDVADMMKKTITALGFAGELEVEQMSLKAFQYRMSKEQAKQKEVRRRERYNQRLKDSLEDTTNLDIKHI